MENLSQEFIKKYEAKGVDLGLLRLSLEKTPTERIETNLRMLEFMEEMQRARKKNSKYASKPKTAS